MTVLVQSRDRYADPAFRITALAGTLLIAALGLALFTTSPDLAALAVGCVMVAVLIAVLVLGRSAIVLVRTHSSATALGLLLVLGLAVMVGFGIDVVEVGRRTLPLGGALALGFGGLALISDELRRRARSEQQDEERSPWQQLTATARLRALPWPILVGVLLIGWSAGVALLAVKPAGDGGLLGALITVGVLIVAAALVGVPMMVAAAAAADRRRLARMRHDERQRIAAHLHDSVLQTLSLVQRQAGDPGAVISLARRQEHALRAWMAGHGEWHADTFAGALQAAALQVEEEDHAAIQLTVTGDRSLDQKGRELLASCREAMRNAARHAPDGPIVVFAHLDDDESAHVYVRDEGAGFDPDAVPIERRGIRDAIIARMYAVGGHTAVDSRLGEGTEITLSLPAGRHDDARA